MTECVCISSIRRWRSFSSSSSYRTFLDEPYITWCILFLQRIHEVSSVSILCQVLLEHGCQYLSILTYSFYFITRKSVSQEHWYLSIHHPLALQWHNSDPSSWHSAHILDSIHIRFSLSKSPISYKIDEFLYLHVIFVTILLIYMSLHRSLVFVNTRTDESWNVMHSCLSRVCSYLVIVKLLCWSYWNDVTSSIFFWFYDSIVAFLIDSLLITTVTSSFLS